MIGAFIKRRLRAFWCGIVGLLAGALAAHLIGGIGIAMRGVAFSIPVGIVLAMAGAIIGYRAGNKRDRAATK
jgi:hypothetical protein